MFVLEKTVSIFAMVIVFKLLSLSRPIHSFIHLFSHYFHSPTGDRIVEINSVSLDGYSRPQAIELLKTSPSKAIFVLERYKQNRTTLVSFFYLQRFPLFEVSVN